MDRNNGMRDTRLNEAPKLLGVPMEAAMPPWRISLPAMFQIMSVLCAVISAVFWGAVYAVNYTANLDARLIAQTESARRLDERVSTAIVAGRDQRQANAENATRMHQSQQAEIDRVRMDAQVLSTQNAETRADIRNLLSIVTRLDQRMEQVLPQTLRPLTPGAR